MKTQLAAMSMWQTQKDFFMTAASSAFHIVGFFEQCTQDMNVQRKYYWQP